MSIPVHPIIPLDVGYPCDIFFMRENKPFDVLYQLIDDQKEVVQENTYRIETRDYRIDKCEVSSFQDVLNVQNLPGFIRYIGIETVDELSIASKTHQNDAGAF
jgi:hypothetical protein